jgi:erythronate-4-phosphate dehydrogenase
MLEGTKVKFIASATIGFDHIDVEYCDARHIVWTNAPGCNSASVQQYIGSALVELARKHKFSLRDRTLGVIGVGNVGKKVVKIAEYLGMRVLLNDPPRLRNEGPCQFISLDGILREADIITFHVPLNREGIDKTYHMADKNFFERVLPGTIIMNSSRGEVVDNAVLREALKSGKIAGAVLDVWENEPEIDRELLKLVDIATPHIAGYSADGKANGTTMSIKSLSSFFDLGIDDWEPEEIPLPVNTVIPVDSDGKENHQVLEEAISATYKILDDDKRLRASVETFEKQRGNYPLRREYPAYEIRLLHAEQHLEHVLRKLGFKVKQIK